MVEEDHYAEFCLLFRLMHTSRFSHSSDDACIMEQWFNRSIESGNRIRAGLSDAVQKAMEILGRAVVCGKGDGNEAFRQAIMNGEANSQTLNKEYEIVKLRKRIEELERENELLKNFRAFLSQDHA